MAKPQPLPGVPASVIVRVAVGSDPAVGVAASPVTVRGAAAMGLVGSSAQTP